MKLHKLDICAYLKSALSAIAYVYPQDEVKDNKCSLWKHLREF